MDATIMPSTLSLLKTLKRDLPDVRFAPGDEFHWSPDEHVIYYANTTDATLLLHEVAHAVLRHTNYEHDIELLKMEREAWDFTTTALADKYKVTIDDEKIETTLDTYRDWLHGRSLCPSCSATGVQVDKTRYSCLACKTAWRVNEARTCALRRYKQ